MQSPTHRFTAFIGPRLLASGPLAEVALAVRKAGQSPATGPILIFDDATGRPVDFDLRCKSFESSTEEIASAEPRGRGRPKLGVVAREVTLLPRHWEWLANQPGGASVALRKLVDEARRTSGDRDRHRAARDAAYHFMSAMAGDLPGFEEASRALFAGERRRFSEHIAGWPDDVRDHIIKLAFSDRADTQGA